MKHYVIWQGHQTGVFDNRQDVQQHVVGYPKAEFKSFPTLEAAEFARKYGNTTTKGQSDPLYLQEVLGDDFQTSIATDAACPSNPGPIEYRGVLISSTEEIFRVGPLTGGSVNLGEFLGIVHGLSRMLKHKQYTTLFSDSKTAISWVQNNTINTTITRNDNNKKLRDLLDRAQVWLTTNAQRSNNITLKQRDSKNLGEIPADFGRK